MDRGPSRIFVDAASPHERGDDLERTTIPPKDPSSSVIRDRRVLYGNLRRQLPLIAAGFALSMLVALIPYPHARTSDVAAAGILFVVLTGAAVYVPWARLPVWLWLSIPIGYIAVVALLRDTQSDADTGLAVVYLLPVVWVAYYDRITHLLTALAAVLLALAVPIIVVGSPSYPPSQWRLVTIVVVGSALVSFTFLGALRRERDLRADVARQAELARSAASEAEAAHDRLDSLLQAATGTAVVGADNAGTVTFFSAGAEEIFGISSHDAVGKKTLGELLALESGSPLSFTRSSLDGTEPPGTSSQLLLSYVGPHGDRRRMAATVTAQPASGTPLSGFVIVASDVTEREELVHERERLLAIQREVSEVLALRNAELERLTSMKDDLVATVSHELRTPLTSIIGFTELLVDESSSEASSFTDEQRRMLRAIERNSQQLLHVANDLLEDPALGSGRGSRFVQVELEPLLEDAIDAVRTATARSRVEITLRREPSGLTAGAGGVTVSCDPARLRQLLSNLLTNAVKFNGPGGHVELRVTSLGDFVRLEVSDDGPGIPEQDRPQLFEPFYRGPSGNNRGVPGSGLGLAIVKSVVDAHGGTIEVVDVPGWSTTFRVHLPALGATSDPTEP
ncbi:MAG: PAS domain-containing sensor histidine kinase [Actinomycetota bacterium]|jgi:PAS domain S-box-containing protein|nr:PAS domain-containing sensor histidine kinase [Actinomycetota bacterium]